MQHQSELHRALVQNIYELKNEINSRTDLLLFLLGGAPSLGRQLSAKRTQSRMTRPQFASNAEMGLRLTPEDFAVLSPTNHRESTGALSVRQKRVKSPKPSDFELFRSKRSLAYHSTSSQNTIPSENAQSSHFMQVDVITRSESNYKSFKNSMTLRPFSLPRDKSEVISAVEEESATLHRRRKSVIPEANLLDRHNQPEMVTNVNASLSTIDQSQGSGFDTIRKGANAKSNAVPLELEAPQQTTIPGKPQSSSSVSLNSLSVCASDSPCSSTHENLDQFLQEMKRDIKESPLDKKGSRLRSLEKTTEISYLSRSQQIMAGAQFNENATHIRSLFAASSPNNIISEVQKYPDETLNLPTKCQSAETSVGFSFSSRVQDLVVYYCLIPAYDTKGRKITAAQFEIEDLNGISFVRHGLHPNSHFNSVWKLVISLLYILSLWAIPFIVAFKQGVPARCYSASSLAISTIFFLDSVVTLLTPHPISKSNLSSFREFESQRPYLREHIQHWIKKELLLDILAVCPFDILFSSWEYTACLFLLLRLLRFRRFPHTIATCPAFIQLWERLDAAANFNISKLIPLTVGILFYSHYNACALYAMGRVNDFPGWGRVWIEFEGATLWQFYTWSYFQALGNMFPMSFKPDSPSEQLVAIAFIFCGAILYGVFVGYISSTAISIDNSGRLYNQKLEELQDYVKWKNLNDETRDKLLSYYETKYRGKYFEEDSLLADMNESLRTVRDIALVNQKSNSTLFSGNSTSQHAGAY
ncbi:hypothetical protein BC830DRAFT_1152303 [Chytriomyces sp. MP71]|nr:hypothetical protein BC830DRAFT_1152303 [Chytriomyces sp. MP71]